METISSLSFEFENIPVLLIRTLIIFVFTFLILRFLGKRQLTHFTYIDLLLIIALGSAVGDAIIYTEETVPLLSSIIGVLFVGILVKIINEFASHSKHFSSLIQGQARLVAENGKIISKELAKEDLSEEDLMRMLREHGITSTTRIRRAYLETDGELSIIFRRNPHHNHNSAHKN